MTRRKLHVRDPMWSGAIIRLSCSWCHEINTIGKTDAGYEIINPTLCIGCGHRADVPRFQCDCTVCRNGFPPLTKEQVDEMIARLEAGGE